MGCGRLGVKNCGMWEIGGKKMWDVGDWGKCGMWEIDVAKICHNSTALPLYAYETTPPDPTPIDFTEIFGSNSVPVNIEKHTVFKKDTVLLLNSSATEMLADVVLGALKRDYVQGDPKINVNLYCNDYDNPLFLSFKGATDVTYSDVVREVHITSLNALSEHEYETFVGKDSVENASDDESELVSIQIMQTKYKRSRRLPKKFEDHLLI